MQNTTIRYIVLVAVLLLGAWLGATIDASRVERAARWPSEDAVFAAGGWTVSRETIQESWHGVRVIQRTYRRSDGKVATLSLVSSPDAKYIYRAGAEVPFLASGNLVSPAPVELVAPAPGQSAEIIRGPDDRAWLQVYAFGERRGLLGNGPLGWGMVAVDAVLGRPNDYFLARVLVPLAEANDQTAAREAANLAALVFPRLSAWYSA
jgi:hypothetical protein